MSGTLRATDGELPERLFRRVVHRVDDREHTVLAHALEVLEDPLAVHRHALEPGVEAECDQPEIGDGPVDLREHDRAVTRLDDAARDREAVRCRVAVLGDLLVHPPGVGDPVGAQIPVPGDHERLVDAAFVHEAQPLGELEAGELGEVGAAVLERPAERVERPADVMVDVEHVEAAHARLRVTDRGSHQAAVSRLPANSGHSRTAVPPSTRSVSPGESRSHAWRPSATRSA